LQVAIPNGIVTSKVRNRVLPRGHEHVR